MSVHPAAGIILGSSCRTREELRGTGHVRTRCFDRVMPPPTSILCLLPAADMETSFDSTLVHSQKYFVYWFSPREVLYIERPPSV